MDSTAQTLLIIVSATLSIFLIAFSVALYYLIGVLRNVKRLSEHAENVATAVESAAHAFEKAASPLAAMKLVGTIFDKVRSSNKKEK